MKKQKNLPAPAKAAEPEIVEPVIVHPLTRIEEPDYNTPGERINYHVGMAQHHGRQALAHLIIAGWELSKQKQSIGYGGWVAWCSKNLQISKDTADRYIQFFHKTVGKARNAAEVPLTKKPTLKELAEATVSMDHKSATMAMVDLDIIKRPKNWGGADRGQGRKPKDAAAEKEEVAKELDDIANNPALLYAAVKGPLDAIWKLHSERDVFARLGVDEFREVAATIAMLDDICKRRLGK